MNKRLISITLRSAAFLGALFVVPIFAGAQNPDSKAISDLLVQAREHAVLAEDDAVTLASYTRSRLSWESHARRLQEIKDHTNDLIQEVNQLNSLRDQGSPWQQRAIDQVTPLLREMSGSLTTTIRQLNENQSRVHMPQYEDYVNANSEVMTRTAKLITDLVEFDLAQARASGLEKSLNLPLTAQKNE